MADELGARTEAVELAPSCRLDWLSLSYAPKTPRDMEEILSYFFNVSRHFAEGSQFREGGGRRFFVESLANPDAGVLLRWTPHDGGINAGKVSIDLQGSFFGFTDAADRKAIYLDAAELPDFKKCGRCDTQVTLIDPISDSEAVYREVRDRKVWISGYNSFSQLAPQDSKGDAIDGASTVWGKPTAAVRCLTYNKAIEQKLKGVNAVRHEIRNRKTAAEGYFNDLLALYRQEGEDADTYAERLLVRSVLSKHMTYLDTSRLAHIADKADWPKNWAQNSKPAHFMSEVLDGDVVEVKRQYRVTKRLEESVAAGEKQYGALFALYEIIQAELMGLTYTEALEAHSARCFLHLKDHHLDQLLGMFPKEHHKKLREAFKERRESAARVSEAYAEKPSDLAHGL